MTRAGSTPITVPCGTGPELVIDGIIEPEDLRAELIRRYTALRDKDRSFSRRRHGVTPV